MADGHAVRRVVAGAATVVDLGVAGLVPASRLRVGRGRLMTLAGKQVFETGDGGRWKPLLAPVL